MNSPETGPDPFSLLTEADLDRLREVIGIFGQSGCASLKLSVGSMSIALERAASGTPVPMPEPVLLPSSVVQTPAAKVSEQVIEAVAHGVFYSTPSIGAAPFVAEGQALESGDKIGLLEAMKVFTEIFSDVSGTVIRYLVENGTEVSPGTPIMLLRG